MKTIKSSKELAEFVIPKYEDLIQKSKKDSYQRFRDRLRRADAEEGICNFCSFNGIKFGVYLKKKVRRFQKFDQNGFLKDSSSGFWGYIPVNCANKKKMVEALQLRINILRKHFLNPVK